METGYYSGLLTLETMKLHGSTKNEITKDENGKTVSHLEITEVVLIHCNIEIINKIQESCIHLFKANHWLIIIYFTQKFLFLKSLDLEFL